MKTIRFETPDGRPVCTAQVADTFVSRLRGLLGRREMAEGGALWITPCRSIHTFFLGFPIDAIYLTRDGTATKLETNLSPFRLSFGAPGSHSAVELSAGTVHRLGIHVGDAIVPAP